MSTRRMAYWWFRFVISGRFLERFLNLPRGQDLPERTADASPQGDGTLMEREQGALSPPLKQR